MAFLIAGHEYGGGGGGGGGVAFLHYCRIIPRVTI